MKNIDPVIGEIIYHGNHWFFTIKQWYTF